MNEMIRNSPLTKPSQSARLSGLLQEIEIRGKHRPRNLNQHSHLLAVCSCREQNEAITVDRERCIR